MAIIFVGLALQCLLLCFIECNAQLDSDSVFFNYRNGSLRKIKSFQRNTQFIQKGEDHHPIDAANSITLGPSTDFVQEDDINNKNRSNLKCPTWTYQNNVGSESVCQCGSDIDGVVKCNTTLKKVSIVDGYCITYNEHRNEVVAGKCVYGFLLGSVYRKLPFNVSKLNEAMCGKLNRRGRLCSKCKKGYSPLVYSYDFKCIKCNSSNHIVNWVKYVAIATLPTTCFYFIIVLFIVNVLSPQLYMIVQIGQLVGSAVSIRPTIYLTHHNLLLFNRLLAVPYGTVNIDFFRSFVNNICIDLSTLQTLALDYITAIYPLILVIITYVFVELHARNFKPIVMIWKPFSIFLTGNLNWDIHSSIVKVFTTVLLLSYGKLLNVMFDLLLPTKLYNVRGESLGLYLYFDTSYKYFQQEHLPYAILALSIIFIFLIPPPLILLLYLIKGCRKCLNARGLALQTFVECFYGYYKDGTEPGMWDCRWFPVMWFLLKSLVLFAFFGISKNLLCYVSLILFAIGVTITVVILKPYKLPYAKYNTIDTVFLLLLAMWCASMTFLDEAWIRSKKLATLALIITITIAVTPIIYVSMLFAYWLYKTCLQNCCNKCLEKLTNNRMREQNFDDSSLINALEQERNPPLTL